jgi:hypoxanthine-guanine phosphoribosyltransferase
MPDATPKAEQLRQIISADQIQKRVKEMARQISDDFRGKTVHALARRVGKQLCLYG